MLLRLCPSSPSPEGAQAMTQSMALFPGTQRKTQWMAILPAARDILKHRRLSRRLHRTLGHRLTRPSFCLVLKTLQNNTVDIQASAIPLASELCHSLDGLIVSVPVMLC